MHCYHNTNGYRSDKSMCTGLTFHAIFTSQRTYRYQRTFSPVYDSMSSGACDKLYITFVVVYFCCLYIYYIIILSNKDFLLDKRLVKDVETFLANVGSTVIKKTLRSATLFSVLVTVFLLMRKLYYFYAKNYSKYFSMSRAVGIERTWGCSCLGTLQRGKSVGPRFRINALLYNFFSVSVEIHDLIFLSSQVSMNIIFYYIFYLSSHNTIFILSIDARQCLIDN